MNKNPKPQVAYKNRRRLTDALRALNTEVVTCDTSDNTFFEMIETIESLSKKLAGQPRRTRTVAASAIDEIKTEGNLFHYGELLDFSPAAGLSNPIAPPMYVHKGENSFTGQVNFSRSYEGAPGFVHGGYIAAMFDEFLGLTQSLTGKAGWTGTLTTVFRSPCRVNTDLRLKGWVVETNGRKVIAKGTMHAGDTLVAEAEAVFIHA